jgi:intracellular septation protein A
MISTTKQNWNRATIGFLIASIIQIIIEYGKDSWIRQIRELMCSLAIISGSLSEG